MLSKRLEELRTERKLSKKQMADFLKIDQSTYGKYELGKREPDYDMIKKLADFFNVSVDYLLCRTDAQETLEFDDEVNELLEELHKRPEMKMLFSISRKATKEDIEKAVKIIEALKEQ
jgi:transcriptional regulator with XRE-family HTH domain